MSEIILGVGDWSVANSNSIIKTYSLGSCVALIMIDPESLTGGMAHIALPESNVKPQYRQSRPGYFADTAIPLLIQEMQKKCSCSNIRRFIIKLVGGATVLDPNSIFDIGKRNILAIKKLLWQKGMGPKSEDIGGSIPRTVLLDVNSGKTIISSTGRGQWEI